MHKTMLAALIVATSALSVPALAQVSLGGAAQVDAGARVNTAASNAAHTAGQTTAQTEQALHRTDSHAKHRTRKAVDKTRSTVNDHANANANANASGTIGAGAGDSHANAGAGLDTAATAGKAGETGLGVGGDVRDAAHSAIQSTDRSAGSVGNAVQRTATGQSVGAGVKADANAGVHGH